MMKLLSSSLPHPFAGGLGIRRTAEHADSADAASLLNYVSVRRVLVYPFFVLSLHPAVRRLRPSRLTRRSTPIWSSEHPQTREEAVDVDHRASRGAWDRSPSFERCRVPPRSPVIPHEIPCPLCMQTVDKLGDHASCCERTEIS